MPEGVVHSVYKPPNKKFVLPALEHGHLPHIVIGDFNSHNTTWGYTTTDDNGEAGEQWSDLCNLTLIQNEKLSKSFNIASMLTCMENQSWNLSLVVVDHPSMLVWRSPSIF